MQAQALGGGAAGGGELGGGGGRCRLRTAGLLGWSFWGIGTNWVNTVVRQIALPLIQIKMFLSMGGKKILRTIWYSCLCNETLEAMPKQFGKILLFGLSKGHHSWKMHARGFLKPLDDIFVPLKNRNREPGM